MTYMEKESDKEIILVRYYNILFYLIFRRGTDEYKKNIFINRINSGEGMLMKDIYDWCQQQSILLKCKFIYRKDFSIMANIWNVYSYCRFLLDISKQKKKAFVSMSYNEILYLIFDYPHKHYTFKHFEI